MHDENTGQKAKRHQLGPGIGTHTPPPYTPDTETTSEKRTQKLLRPAVASEPPWDRGSGSASRGSRQRTCENQTSWGRAGRARELITFLFSMQATQRQKRSLEEVHWTPRQYTHMASSCCSFFFVFLRAHTRTHMAVTVGAHTHAHTFRTQKYHMKLETSEKFLLLLLFIIYYYFLWFLAQQSSSKWWWRWWCGQDRRSVTSDRQKPIIIINNIIIIIISSAVNGLL